MEISMNKRGNEMYVDSRKGRYTAIAPVQVGVDGKIEVITPSGRVTRMTQAEWLRIIAITSEENGLVRSPRQDEFVRGKGEKIIF